MVVNLSRIGCNQLPIRVAVNNRTLYMSEDPHPSKKTLVDLSSSFDRIYWRHRFQTTDMMLAEAVGAVGQNPRDIGAYIEIRRAEKLRELQHSASVTLAT
jgi:hypothetical protein